MSGLDDCNRREARQRRATPLRDISIVPVLGRAQRGSRSSSPRRRRRFGPGDTLAIVEPRKLAYGGRFVLFCGGEAERGSTVPVSQPNDYGTRASRALSAKFCSVRPQTPARPSARICVADKLVCALVGARPAPSASDRSTTGTTCRLRTDQLVSRELASCDVLTSAPPLTEGQQLPQLSRSRRGRWSQRL